MFDNQKPNVILLTDLSDVIIMPKVLGPYKVAQALRSAGFEVMVIQHLHTYTLDELKYLLQNLVSDKTLFVGFNTMFYNSIEFVETDPSKPKSFSPITDARHLIPHGVAQSIELVDFIKNLNPNIKITRGGARTADESHNSIMDYIFIGYGEKTVVNLAEHLIDATIPLVKSYKSVHGPIVFYDPKGEDIDFTNTTTKFQQHDGILSGETLIIEISRGCTFNCAFCSFPLRGKNKTDYIKKEEILYNEFLDNYTTFGITRYIFCDDTFNDCREKIEMINRISNKLPFELEYWAWLRLDLLARNMDLAEPLYNSGLRGCYFGVDTLNSKSASIIGKSGKREKMFDTLWKLKEIWKDRVMISLGLILGLPADDEKSINESIDIVKNRELPITNWNVIPMSIFNNTNQANQSVIDANYNSYRYKKIGSDDFFIHWENDHTNYQDISKVVDMLNQNQVFNRLNDPVAVFNIAGLGIDINTVKKKKFNDIDWHYIFKTKESRAIEYKMKLYNIQKISPYKDVTRFPWSPEQTVV